MIDIEKNNLDNIKVEYNLFGERISKLNVKDRIGFLPTSIWRPKWSETTRLKKIIGDFGQTRILEPESKNYGMAYKKTLGTKTSYNTSEGLGVRGNDLSIFNPHLAQMILSAYCPPNARIFDPFAGGGTRAIIAAAMGHDYYGVELRQNEVDRIMKKGEDLKLDFFIIEGDGQTEDFDREDWFDFSYTCPPYYNLEIYSHLQDDLSNADSYQEFLDMLGNCIVNTYNVLKDNALSVWVVGNFRDEKGELIHFNGDLIKLAKKVGFKLHDEIIFEGASNVAKLRSGNFVANRKSIRIHEYILIFKK